MEKKMEITKFGAILCIVGYIGVYIGRMEKEMETTI